MTFGTIYKFEKEENFDALAASLNLFEEAKAGFKKAPEAEALLKHDDGTWTMVIYLPNNEMKIKFTPGVEMNRIVGDHKELKTLFTFEDKVLVQKLSISDSDAIFVKRDFSDDGKILKVTYSTNYSDVVGTRYFKSS